ncbi:M56 family metallopeptidase [Streptomyces tsukubensis]|uniref:Peptidase M48 domain-containing protein n=1 Tax=Streptomyces tsukubensis TaxID=83656 RepID=A0A1V4A5A9_9ACTN|nr:M56 family metallopeptidase [Streptomyces tsukubensis]OON75356.1 hypothetical protein B1H18_22995 [Streptomyces tsukubensis]QFR95013.1 M48 family metalloprotease [Streptomyces tsukubensis]
MGLFVFLPFVLPLTALPVARLAEQHLHPRAATRLLTALSVVLALCSTVCLGLLVVVGTARLPGNPLPDSWADPEVRAVVPYDEFTGFASIAALLAAATACSLTLARHRRVRVRSHRALAGLPAADDPAILTDDEPYAYALPGRPGRIVVSSAMFDCLDAQERRALVAHERAHLTGGHHRLLLAARLAACANPLLRPLYPAIAYGTERWADEEAALAVGDRRVTARAVGKAALSTRGAVPPPLPAFAAPGPVPRRVAALLSPAPPAGAFPPARTPTALAILMAGAGAAVSAASSFNAMVTLLVVLEAATPL